MVGAKFQGRGGALDALRFFAAFSLLFYHWADNAPTHLGEIHPVFTRGYLATDFFLMLSGYVVARAYGRKLLSGALNPLTFLGKRFERLWPSHAIVLALMATLVGICALLDILPQHPQDFRWQDLVCQFLLLHGLPGAPAVAWNSPTWTLSALFFCYAATPMFLRATRKPGVGLMWACLALTVADLICLALTGQGVFSLHIGVLRALPLYFVGVAIARVCEATNPPPSPMTTRTLGLGAGAILVLLQVFGEFNFASVAAIGVIIYAAGVRPVARPNRLVELGARLSLALFLTHALVATVWFGAVHHVLRRQDASTGVWWLIWAFSFPVALVAAYAFDRYVDQPVQKWLANRHAPALAERKTTVSAS